MLRPARMVHLNVLVLDSEVDRATREMIKSGVVHLVSVTDLEPWATENGMEPVQDEDSGLLARVENAARSIAEKLGIGPETVSEALAFQPFDPYEASKNLEELSREVNSVVAARDEAALSLASLKEARSEVARDFQDKLGIAVPSRYTLLDVAIGHLPEKNLDRLKRLLSDVPNVVLTFAEEKGRVGVMAIVLKKDHGTLQRATEEAGLERTPVSERKAPASEEIIEHLEERIEKAQEELDKARAAVHRCKEAHLPMLRTLLSQVSLQKLTRLAKSRFRKTARTYLISGWTSRQNREKVVEGLREACGNRCLIEEQTAEQLLSERGEKVDVPILFENPKALRPFEMLVSSYGRPAYNSIDPTVVVAPTFLLMYGAMFGDVGQGAVMAILGALVSRWKRVTEGVRRIGELFTWCGCSAVLFGFLYGSVFGFKNILPYAGFELLENVDNFRIIVIALCFGMAMITIGLVFNVISAIGRKEWAAGLFDWKGLMGLAFYWLAVAVVVRILAGGSASPTLIGVLLLVPVLAALVKAPLDKLMHRRDLIPQHGFAFYTLRSIGQIFGASIETIIMFFANTLSFLRLAAFAVAHAALFIAVFSLADVLKGGGPALPIVIHILGNAGMITLEGLVVCVQALRLEYYEFFGKFFQVGRTEFSPMKLPRTVP